MSNNNNIIQALNLLRQGNGRGEHGVVSDSDSFVSAERDSVEQSGDAEHGIEMGERNSGSTAGKKRVPHRARQQTKVSAVDRDFVIESPMLRLRVQVMRENPHFTSEEAKVVAQREYNRLKAARARMRTKQTIKNLEEKHANLGDQLRKVSKENKVLKRNLNLVSGLLSSLMKSSSNPVGNQSTPLPTFSTSPSATPAHQASSSEPNSTHAASGDSNALIKLLCQKVFQEQAGNLSALLQEEQQRRQQQQKQQDIVKQLQALLAPTSPSQPRASTDMSQVVQVLLQQGICTSR